MRKLLIAVAAVLGLLLVAALVVPALVDWSRYRDDIEARLEKATGREVTIAGDVGLRLLPAPAFTAERITVASLPGMGDQPLAAARELAIRLQLLPLLTGEVAIESLVLREPAVHLVKLADGRDNWTFSPAQDRPSDAGPGADAPSPSTPGPAVSIGDLRIEDGRVTYSAAGTAPVVAEDVDARIEADTLAGPFLATGDLTLAGTEIAFEGALDRLAEDRGSPLRLTVTLPRSGASLRFTGMLSRMAEGAALRGSLAVAAADPSRLPGSPPLAGPLAVEANLAVSNQGAALTDLVATAAETRATGAVSVGFGEPTRIDADLEVATLDLDRWLAKAPAPPAAQATAPPPPPAADTLPGAGTAQSPPPTFSLPKDVFADLGLSVGTLSYRGAVIQQARVQATLADGELVVHGASAQGPGGSVASLAGVLAEADGRPVFDGQAELRADNLRAMLDWLGVDSSAVAPGRLRRMEASASLRAAWPEIEVRDLAVSVDGTTAEGGVTARMTDRPAFGVALTVGTLNLDAYRAPPTAKPAEAEAAPAARAEPAPASPEAPPPATDALAGFDADLRLSVARLTANDVTADSIRVSALLQQGALTLREAQATVAGSRLGAEGRILGLGQERPRAENLTVTVDSPQPAKLIRFLGMEPPGAAAQWGRLTASARLDGGFDALTLDARAATGGVEATVAGTVSNPLTQPAYRLALRAASPSTVQLVRLFAPSYRPAGSPGAFALQATVAGDSRSVALSALALTAGPARVTGEARADLSGPKPDITADLAANALALGPFLPADRTGFLLPVPGGLRSPPALLPGPVPSVVPAANGTGSVPWSREALELGALRAFNARVQLKAEAVRWDEWALTSPQALVVVRDGALALDSLTGRLLEGALSAQGRLSSDGVPALTGSLSIKDARLENAKLGAGGITLTQGRLSSDFKFATSGRSSHDMAQRLGGNGSLTVAEGIVSGFDLAAVNKRMQNIDNLGSVLGLVQSGLQGGQTRFSKLAGTFVAESGVVTTRDLRLDAEGGTATGEAVIRLAPWTMQAAIAFQLAGSQTPPAVVRLEGPIDNPRKIIDINALQQHLAARGLGRALKGTDAGSLVEGLLGGKPKAQQQQQQPDQAPADPQAEQKPEKVLRDLLKGLVR